MCSIQIYLTKVYILWNITLTLPIIAQECPPGMYGKNCDTMCSETCNISCHAETGRCFKCLGNRIGPFCDDCPKKWYGPLCEIPCPHQCVGSMCDIWSGICDACDIGYHGNFCDDVCERGFYGSSCQLECSTLCNERLCDPITGECLSCVGNRIGIVCTECPERFYGPLCATTCPENCRNHTCNKLTGECVECADGYSGRRCFYSAPPIEYWEIIFLFLIVTTVVLICLICYSQLADCTFEQPTPRKRH